MRKLKTIICIFMIISILILSSSFALALEPYEKYVYDSHENTELRWYDPYGNLVYVDWTWDGTNDHPTMEYYEFVGYDPTRWYEGTLDKYAWGDLGSYTEYYTDGSKYEEHYYIGYYSGLVYLFIFVK